MPTQRDGLAGADSLELAGLGRRFAAALLDGVFMGLWLLVGLLTRLLRIDNPPNLEAQLSASFYGFPWTLATEGILVGFTGATLGKLLLGIRIVRTDGSPIGFATAFGRWLGKVPSAIFLIGYIMAVFDRDQRALHDRIAGTLVVRSTRPRPVPLADAAGNPFLDGWGRVAQAVGIAVIAGLAIAVITHSLDPLLGASPMTPGRVLFRISLGGTLQAAVGGVLLRNGRALAITSGIGLGAGVAVALLFLGVSALGLDRPWSQLTDHMFILVGMATSAATGAAIGAAVGSPRLRTAGMALGCIAYLRFPVVSQVATWIRGSDAVSDPNPWQIPFWILNTGLLWLLLGIGFRLLGRAAPAAAGRGKQPPRRGS